MSNNETDQFVILTRIIQMAALKTSTKDQVHYILEKLCETLNIDVCSLYQKLDDNSLSMVSTHGLTKTHPIVIPPGKGLVGKVISSRHILNIVEPSLSPDYFYVTQTNEEKLHSFCGVPVFSLGHVSGVLVVQGYQTKVLDSSQEALLATLAIHLGLLLESLDIKTQIDVNSTVIKKGITGAPGLAIGRAHTVTVTSLFDTVRTPVENISQALTQWEELKRTAKQSFINEQDIINKSLGKNLSLLVEAYAMMLEDPIFDTLVKQEINEGVSLTWALRKTVEHLVEQFKSMDDPYLQARCEDIEHLGENLFQLWRDELNEEIEITDEPIVLVGRSISVSNIAKLLSKNLAAIICTEGAALSHIAVFANALGIPAIMGTGNISLPSNNILIVDGDNAQLIVNPDDATLHEYKQLIEDKKHLSDELLKNITQTTTTSDGVSIRLMVNSGLQADIDPGLRFGAEGVGLFRTELPFMARNSLPSEDEQVDIYRHVLEKYEGRPVYIRTLDIGSDKPLPYLPEIQEENPALGLRGIRYTLDNLPLLDTQLRAILRASEANDQLYVVFPMVTTTEQLDQCLSLLDAARFDLSNKGLAIARPKVGIMLEVPSSISLLPVWSKKLDFVSVGTNDLTQYLLAADRNNSLINKCFDHFHPAVFHELSRISQICQQHRLTFSICGELASLPLASVLLLGLGCRQLSLSAAKIPLINALIKRIDLADATELFEHALQQDSAIGVRNIALDFFKSLNLPFESLLFDAR